MTTPSRTVADRTDRGRVARRDRLRPAGGSRVRGPVRDLPRQRQPRAGAEDRPLARTASPARPRCSSSRTRTSSCASWTTSARRTCSSSSPPRRPVNQSIMELLIMIDAFKRASAGPDHGRRPVLRVRAVRQEGPAAGADHRAPGRRHDHGRRRGPDADDGPPPGPDPGVLQHPGRRAHRGPHAQPLLHRQAPRGVRRGHRPRVREAGPRVRRDPRRAAGDRREAPPRQPRPGRGHQRHRRGPRPAGDHRRRRGRHRRAR